MINREKLNAEYAKTNDEIEKLEGKLSDLQDHKKRLRCFYEIYFQNKKLKKGKEKTKKIELITLSGYPCKNGGTWHIHKTKLGMNECDLKPISSNEVSKGKK